MYTVQDEYISLRLCHSVSLLEFRLEVLVISTLKDAKLISINNC